MKYIGVSKISAGCSAGLFCIVVLPLAASGASSGSLCRRGQTEQLLCAPRGLASSPAAQGMLLRVSQHENMTERCSPIFWEHATTISNLAEKHPAWASRFI